MSGSDEQPVAEHSNRTPESAIAVPRDTTPTWEMELLLSGAVVFAMMQLPGLLDSYFDALSARLTSRSHTLVLFGYLYAKVVLLALIATFLAHLVTRGFWVALIGLRSVFPAGVLWEKLNQGPNYIEVAKSRTLPLGELVERADNFASLVFAFGFLLVLMAVTSLFVTGAIIGLAHVVSEWILGGRYRTATFWTIFSLALLPMLIAGVLDNRVGRRLPREHWVARSFRGVFRSMYWLTVGWLATPMLLTFTSHVGRRKGMAIVIGAIYLLIGWVVADMLVRRGDFGVDDYAYLPETGGARLLDPRNYADQRVGSARFSTRPYVTSEIARGRYLKLVVPYAPDRHGPALESGCPEATPAESREPAAETARRNAVLDCFARLHAIKLDGTAMPALAFDFYTDAQTGLRGAAAFIPLARLAPGRHELEIVRPPRVSDSAVSRKTTTSDPDRIAFWR